MAERVGLQQRMEESRWGSVAISSLISLTVVAGCVSAARNSNIVRVPLPVVALKGLTNTGLNQHWGMFAPPPRESPNLMVDIEYADGTRERWSWPGRRFGQYRAYHWGKIEEAIVMARHPGVASNLAGWLAREHAGSRHGRVARVRMRERWRLLAPPGPGPLVLHEHVYDINQASPGRSRTEGKTV